MSVPTTASRTAPRLRKLTMWKLSTALVGTLYATAAFGELPSGYTLPINYPDPQKPVVTVSNNGQAMTVDLNKTTTVMDWVSFNITGSSSVRFTVNGNAATAVLNRVSTGNPSTITGALTSKDNVAVWLVNTSGITIGNGGSFSGGSLVLSASDIAPADFGNATMSLSGVNTSAAINLTGTGTIAAKGSFVAVGQNITANKTISADQQVTLIAARDIDMPFTLGSPLAFTITKGTNLGTASVSVGGAISAPRITLAGASEGGAIANLLNVTTLGSLVADDNNGFVVLATKTSAAAGITITSQSGTDGITVAGTIASGGNNNTGLVTIASTGAVNVTGAVNHGDDYIISGKSVLVSGAMLDIKTVEATGGDISLTALSGDITSDTISATGAVSLTAEGFNIGTAVNAGTALSLDQTKGNLTWPLANFSFGTDLSLKAAGDVTVGALTSTTGNVTLNAGNDVVGSNVTATNGNISITAGRNVKDAGGRMSLKASGTISVLGTNATSIGTALLSEVSAGGAATISNDVVNILDTTITLTSATATNGNLTLAATGAAGDIKIDSVSATGGNISITALGGLGGRALGGRTGLITTGVNSDISINVAGAAFLGTADAAANLSVTANSIDMTGGFARSGDAVLDSATTAALGDVTAGKSIAARARGTTLTAGTLLAGEDVALSAVTTINVGNITSGDDIDLSAGGAITGLTLTANGIADKDGRTIDLTGPTIVFSGSEATDHAFSNVRVKSTGSSIGLAAASTTGAFGGDIALDGSSSINIGALDAHRSIGVLSATGGFTATGNLNAGEDIAISAGAVSLLDVTAADDIDISGTTVNAGAIRATGTGSFSDVSRVVLVGGVSFLAPELAARSGADINITSTSGDVIATSLRAASDVSATAALNLRLNQATADDGNVALTATTGSVTGLAGASTGTSDTGFGRTSITAAMATRDITVTAGQLAQLGTVQAGQNVVVTGGKVGSNGAIDITSATATDGILALTARAVLPIVGSALDGDILLGTGKAKTGAALTNTATGGTAGNIIISDRLSAEGNVALQSAADILIAQYTGGTVGVIESTAGSLQLAAGGSIYGIGGPSTMPLERGIDGIEAGRDLTVNGGDVRIGTLKAGRDLFLNVTGSLTGRLGNSLGTNISGGGLFAKTTINVAAGNLIGNIARFNTVQAEGDININAASIAIGTLKSTAGAANYFASIIGESYVGLLFIPGDYTFNAGGLPSLANSVTGSFIFDPIYGSTNLTATTGSITQLAAMTGVAQLGTVFGKNGVTLTAAGLAANQVSSTNGAISLTASVGTLALGTVSGGGTVNLTKLSSSGSSDDELRVLTSASGTGDVTISSASSARVALASSTAGNLSVTATGGDVTGSLRTIAATDGRIRTSYDRADLDAQAAGKSVTVTASAGFAQLGTIVAGTGLTTSLGDQIKIDALNIDVISATASNGNLAMNASSGAIQLTTGHSGVNSTLLATNGILVDSLTARTGDILISSTFGSIAGRILTTPIADGRPLSIAGRSALTASAAGKTITVSALNGTTQLGALSAGAGLTTTAIDQIKVDAREINATSANAFNGNLKMTASAGSIVLGSGNAGVDATLLASTSVRVGDLLSRTGDLSVTATTGDVSGLQRTSAATDGRLLTAYDRATLTASAASKAVTVSALAGTAQLAAVNAGTGLTTSAGDQVKIDATQIDVTSANAANGNLKLTASTGDVLMANGAAGIDAIVSAGTNVRVDSLTARTGNVSVTATGGNISGLAITPVADGRPLSGFGRANLTASAADKSVTASAVSGIAQLGAVAAGATLSTIAGDQIKVDARAIDITSALASNGNLKLTATAGDVVLAIGSGGVDAALQASGSVRVGDLTARTGNLTVTATGGDVTGSALVPGAVPLATNLVGPLFSPSFKNATLIASAATGNITVSALGGVAQFDTINAGLNVTATAKALSALAAIANNGELRLTATTGSLIVDAGVAGTNAVLTKLTDQAGIADELSVHTLFAGTLNGSSGFATVDSATNVRIDTIEARGGAVTLFARGGQLTGRAGGRAKITAARARDSLGSDIFGTASSVRMETNGITLLGNVSAGTTIDGVIGNPTGLNRLGSLDMLTASAGGDINLVVTNSIAGFPNGLKFLSITGGRSVFLGTDRSNGGDILGNVIDASGDAVMSASGSITVTSVDGKTIGARAGGFIKGTFWTGREDVYATALGSITLQDVSAGDDIVLKGASITLGNATASGTGPDTTAINMTNPLIVFDPESAGLVNANINLTSTTGGITVIGDLAAQRDIVITSADSAKIQGQVTAGKDLLGTVIRGDYLLTAFGLAQLGRVGIASTQKASGEIRIDAIGVANLSLGAGLVLQSNSDGIGTEALQITSSAFNIALADTKLIGGRLIDGRLPGRESEIRLIANNGSVAFDTADGNGVAVRAGQGITITGAINAGNAARPADPVAGYKTVDLATTANGITMTTAKTFGAGHDILISAPGALVATKLTATRDVTVTASTMNLENAEATEGALALTATGGNLTLGSGKAGTTGTLRSTGGTGDVIVITELKTGEGALIEALRHARIASVTTTTGPITVKAVNGEVTGFDDGAVNLISNGGAVTVEAGTLAKLGTVGSATATGITVTADKISVIDADAGTGALSLIADNGTVTLGTGKSGTSAVITSTGLTDVGMLTAKTDATVRGTSVTATSVEAINGFLLIDATAGAASLRSGSAKTTGTVQATGTADVSISLIAGGTARLSAGGAATGTLIRSTAADVVVGGGSIDVTTITAATSLSAISTGLTKIGTATAGTGATVRGMSVDAGTARANGGALVIDATNGSVLLGTGFAFTTATVGATTTTGITTSLTANGALKASAGTALSGGALTSNGADVTLTGQSINLTSVKAETTLSAVASAGNLTLGSATATNGTATLTTSALATLGPVTATGKSITITAADAVLTGNITGSNITIVNKAAGTNSFRLGNGLSVAAGFSLDQGEINRLNAANITFDAGTAAGMTAQNYEIGALALDTDTGSAKIDFLGTRRFDLTGLVTADGSAATRFIRFGGSTTAGDKATVIRVAANADGTGGRLQMPTANLELRANTIGAGQDQAFLSALGLTSGGTPLDALTVNSKFVSNPNSSLYNSAIGGLPYVPLDQVLVSARTLTVKFTEYALFQNTGQPGTSRGVVLGGTLAAPINDVPVLSISGPNPPNAKGFAIFGSINGIVDTGTALLGGNIVKITAVDPANARINGCVIGSGGGGCLVSTLVQPTLSVFDSSKADIFANSGDFEIPFDPVIGTNNESLFGDVGTFGLEEVPLPAVPECVAGSTTPCPTSQDPSK